jgi:NADPH:quinone reductase-like Zn-dependent oxidoreductase
MHMRAAVFRQVGDPGKVLHVEHVAAPDLSPTEVLVDVDASVVQPADFMFVRGQYRIQPRLPQVAGLEGSGVVVESALGTGLRPGTRVAFRHPGCWADRIAVPAASCYVVPQDVPVELAAQFSLNPVTAWALLDEVGAGPGDWIAVSAARSAVAGLIADLALSRDVHVIGLVRAGGADQLRFPVLQTGQRDLMTALLDRTAGEELAGFLDSVGGDVLTAVLPALRPGGTIVSYGVLDDTPVSVRNSDLIYRNLTWKGFGIDHWLATSRPRRDEMTRELWSLIRGGEIDLPVRDRYPLAEIEAAVAAAAVPGGGGKVVIMM